MLYGDLQQDLMLGTKALVPEGLDHDLLVGAAMNCWHQLVRAMTHSLHQDRLDRLGNGVY